MALRCGRRVERRGQPAAGAEVEAVFAPALPEPEPDDPAAVDDEESDEDEPDADSDDEPDADSEEDDESEEPEVPALLPVRESVA